MKGREEKDRVFNPFEAALEDYESSDESMRKCLRMAGIAAKTDLPILILGESGTGKTLLARAIHQSSKRVEKPFISFNAAALSDTLLDSQLFGHEKGAFTDAKKRIKGKFELANQGTLFLDEIADMSLGAQAKILRAIEYGEFQRLGSEEIFVSDVRLISATHLPLQEFIEMQKFRKDLFYRLNGISIKIPPLRERPNDLRALIGSEMARCAALEEKEISGLTKEALEVLLKHKWPGNLRELSRVIHIAVAISENTVVSKDCILINHFSGAEGVSGQHATSAKNGGSADVVEIQQSLEDLSLKAAEAEHILKVLKRLSGNKRQAAKTLGISRSTLDRKLSEINASY